MLLLKSDLIANGFPTALYWLINDFLDSKTGKVYDMQTGGLKFEQQRILWVICRSVLWQDTSEPQPNTADSQEIHKDLSCGHNRTEIMLKLTSNTIQSIGL